MKFYLIVAKGAKKNMPIEITVDLFLLGSDKVCQLRNANLGLKHCALVARDKKVFIRDFDSGKPTLINGEVMPPSEEWPLHAGDKIAVGNLEFVIQMRERALSKRDLEEWAASCLDVDEEKELAGTEEEDEFRPPTNASSAAQSIIDRLSAQRGMVKGRLRVGIDKGVTTVRFNDRHLVDEGEITMIKRELCDNLNKPNLRVLLDLKNVHKMSSTAVVMLTDVSRWLRHRGCTMAMCRIRPELQEILGVLRVENVPTYSDKKLALAARW
jgi:anti-anti-sigma regulatory factor